MAMMAQNVQMNKKEEKYRMMMATATRTITPAEHGITHSNRNHTQTESNSLSTAQSEHAAHTHINSNQFLRSLQLQVNFVDRDDNIVLLFVLFSVWSTVNCVFVRLDYLRTHEKMW